MIMSGFDRARLALRGLRQERIDEPLKIASVEHMPRDSRASRRFEIAARDADEERLLADDRPLVHGLEEEVRNGLLLRSVNRSPRPDVSRRVQPAVESIDMSPFGRELLLHRRVQHAWLVQRRALSARFPIDGS